MDNIQKLLDEVEHLPAFPATTLKLIDVMHSPSLTVSEIVDIIRYDQAITSQILKVCNSAYFSPPSPVTSLDDAMMTIGTIRLLQLVMAMQANELFKANETATEEAYGIDAEQIWKNSVSVAISAANVGNRMNFKTPSILFTIGLLHDIGKIVMANSFQDDFPKIHEYVNENNCSITEAEKAVIGFSHIEAGERLAKEWHLPERIAKAIRYSQEPDDAEEADEAIDILIIALAIARELEEEEPNFELSEEFLKSCELNEGILFDVCDDVVDEINNVISMLSA